MLPRLRYKRYKILLVVPCNLYSQRPSCPHASLTLTLNGAVGGQVVKCKHHPDYFYEKYNFTIFLITLLYWYICIYVSVEKLLTMCWRRQHIWSGVTICMLYVYVYVYVGCCNLNSLKSCVFLRLHFLPKRRRITTTIVNWHRPELNELNMWSNPLPASRQIR